MLCTWVVCPGPGKDTRGCASGPRALVSRARSLVCCSVRPVALLGTGWGLCALGFAFGSDTASHLLSWLQNLRPRVPATGLAHGLQRRPGASEGRASPPCISEATASGERSF